MLRLNKINVTENFTGGYKEGLSSLFAANVRVVRLQGVKEKLKISSLDCNTPKGVFEKTLSHLQELEIFRYNFRHIFKSRNMELADGILEGKYEVPCDVILLSNH